MGPANAATRLALMDATEAVMREEGYAAVSSRRVAEAAGVKQQLVYYYFRTMDELLLATYRRRAAQVLEKIEAVLQNERPLHAFWRDFNDRRDAALTMEYLALANHNNLIRRETIRFGERIRRLEGQRLKRGFSRPRAAAGRVTPYAAIVAITYIARVMGFEASLGIHGGHREARSLVLWCLQRLEPRSAPRADQCSSVSGGRGSPASRKTARRIP